MRCFLLADLIHRFVDLTAGLARVLVWVGIKMALKIDVYYIPTPISLAVITTILATSILASLIATRGQGPQDPPAPAVPPFRNATAEELNVLQPLWPGKGRAPGKEDPPAGKN